MNSTAYLPLITLGQTGSRYEGGISKWWYTPKENLNGFPTLDGATQMLLEEPRLLGGATWYGPVNLPTFEIGYEEPDAMVAAGIYYKQKLIGLMPGANSTAHINIGNLAQKQLCIVAKLRAGGFYIVIGDDEFGMRLSTQFSTGVGWKDTPGTKLTLTLDSNHKALPLTSFMGDPSIAPVDVNVFSGGGSNNSALPNLLIPFNESGDTTINWTSALIIQFGQFPTIELWEWDSDRNIFCKADIPIEAVGNPPTAFIVRNGGGVGFINIT